MHENFYPIKQVENFTKRTHIRSLGSILKILRKFMALIIFLICTWLEFQLSLWENGCKKVCDNLKSFFFFFVAKMT